MTKQLTGVMQDRKLLVLAALKSRLKVFFDALIY